MKKILKTLLYVGCPIGLAFFAVLFLDLIILLLLTRRLSEAARAVFFRLRKIWRVWGYLVLNRSLLIIGWLYAWWNFKVINHVRIIGRHNLPAGKRRRGMLFVSNHQTLGDSFLIGLAVAKLWDIVLYPSRVPWNAPAKENFFSKPLYRWLFKFLNNVPVIRGQQSPGLFRRQMQKLAEALHRGCLLLFFEGTRSRTGQIGECKRAVAYFIYHYQPTSVVPIRLVDIRQIMPIELGYKFFNLNWRRKGALIIGKPLDLTEALTIPDEQIAYDKIKTLIKTAVEELGVN